MKNFIFILFFILTHPLSGQNSDFLSNCIKQVITIDSLNKFFFQPIDGKGKALVIRGQVFEIKNDEYYTLKTIDFKDVKNSVYVEGLAFIYSYDIPIWFSIDSIGITKNMIEMHFKTTAFRENPLYHYISGITQFNFNTGKLISIYIKENFVPFDDSNKTQEVIKGKILDKPNTLEDEKYYKKKAEKYRKMAEKIMKKEGQ